MRAQGAKMTYERQAITAFAQATVAACDLIETKFASTIFTGGVARRVKVDAPMMESTGGGKQARESIVLKADGADPAHNITCGFLDVGLRSCEVRSYAALNLLHRQRHQQGLDLYQSEYDRFIDELKALLEPEGFAFRVVEADEQRAKGASSAAADKGAGPGVMIALGIVAALVVAVIVAVFALK